MSFLAPGGKLTALVGPSGAGKTTITDLVPRLYDPNSGTVRIGSHDVRDVTLNSLHSAIGVVPQEAHLFHGTLRANLLYARPDATEQDLRQACEAARNLDLLPAPRWARHRGGGSRLPLLRREATHRHGLGKAAAQGALRW